jgi:hypothetical protein
MVKCQRQIPGLLKVNLEIGKMQWEINRGYLTVMLIRKDKGQTGTFVLDTTDRTFNNTIFKRLKHKLNFIKF